MDHETLIILQTKTEHCLYRGSLKLLVLFYFMLQNIRKLGQAGLFNGLLIRIF